MISFINLWIRVCKETSENRARLYPWAPFFSLHKEYQYGEMLHSQCASRKEREKRAKRDWIKGELDVAFVKHIGGTLISSDTKFRQPKSRDKGNITWGGTP